MTLTTTVYIFRASEDMPSQTEIWELCADVCNFPMQHRPEPNEDGDMVSPFGVGALAQISVYGNVHYARLSLDTVYGRNGGAIHNNVVNELLKRFPNCHIVALNEFDSEWHLNDVPYSD